VNETNNELKGSGVGVIIAEKGGEII